MTAQIPDGSVIITPTQMYSEIQSANAKIDHLTAIIDPAMQDMRHDVADHETRIRTLEMWRWKAAGVGAAVGAVVAVLGGVLETMMAR